MKLYCTFSGIRECLLVGSEKNTITVDELLWKKKLDEPLSFCICCCFDVFYFFRSL